MTNPALLQEQVCENGVNIKGFIREGNVESAYGRG